MYVGMVVKDVQGKIENYVSTMPYDAMLLSSRESVLYASGVRNMSHDVIPDRNHYVIASKTREPIYVVIASEADVASVESWISDIRPYREFSQSAEEIAVKALKEAIGAGGTIGYESSHLSKRAFDMISSGVPEASFEDCEADLDLLRMIKTEDEIRLLREAAEKTERAIRAGFAASRAGDSERQVANKVAMHLISEGCDNVAWLVLAAGENTKIVHPKASDYELQEGDLVRIDVGAWFGGYLSDIGRTAVVGPPTERQKRCYAKLMKTQDDAIAVAKVGGQMRDIFISIEKNLKETEPRAELPSFPHFGHQLGIGVHERPMIKKDEIAPIQEGMVICIEPYFIDENGDSYHDEELVQVTAYGSTTLTPRSHWRELFQIS